MKRKLIIKNLPEYVFKKLRKKKENDGFADRDWSEWFSHLVEDVRLIDTPGEQIQRGTRIHLLEMWIKNLSLNLPQIWKDATIADLVPDWVKSAPNPMNVIPRGSAIVVGRGPSMYEHKQLEMLAESDYKGTIIACDGALIDCLERDVIPTHVLSVDGNREKIWKYYDSPLVDKYADKIKAVLSTTIAKTTTDRIEKSGMEKYWFAALMDEPFKIENWTTILRMQVKSERNPNGPPCMQCGGNAGTTSWVLAHALLRCSPICLIGLDMGYPEGTPYEETSYWKGMVESVDDNVQVAEQVFKHYYNKFFRIKAFTDPVFDHYRDSLIELTTETPAWIKTISCSHGTLFGPGIEQMYFKDFLAQWKK